jgi:uncharacterized membrane protein YcgQ (UPF0703/DUF1980 family)
MHKRSVNGRSARVASVPAPLKNINMHTYIHTYIYMYTSYTHTHIHTYMHTYIHTHTHSHTHIHTNIISNLQHTKKIMTVHYLVRILLRAGQVEFDMGTDNSVCHRVQTGYWVHSTNNQTGTGDTSPGDNVV